MKTIFLLAATLATLATTSALSLRTDLIAVDSGAMDGPSGADVRGGGGSTAPTHVEESDDPIEPASEGVVESNVIATLPPESVVVAATLDLGTTDASDGPLIVSANKTINLGLAASLCDCDEGGQLDDPCRWDCPSPVPGQGVYDAEKWAVVFKYSSVNISAGTVNFQNHPSRAPVVWLVQGNATITGATTAVNVDGNDGNGINAHAEPGPGGFRGGRGTASGNYGSGGLGPGGGNFRTSGAPQGDGTGGNYADFATGNLPGPSYGNSAIVPLIGGSGGSGHNAVGWAGGAAGGAILIASRQTVTVNGKISAKGGDGNTASGGYAGTGSGGSIRLLGDFVAGNGSLNVEAGGPYGARSKGRIRIEANAITFTGSSRLLKNRCDSGCSLPRGWLAC